MWKHENAPVLRGLMDLCVDPRIEEVTVVKAAQIGGSEAIRNVIGYLAYHDPDPVLLVLPSEDIGRRIMSRRIIPLFQDTPALAKLMTSRANDTQLTGVVLANGFTLNLGWSGSPATLAADPQRMVINDEVNKFAEWSGRESDPVSLARMRTQTYADNRIIVNISTPTIPTGQITRLYNSSPLKLYPWFACTKCGAWQRIIFQRVKWEKFDEKNPDLLASMIRKRRAAWYECDSCDQRIEGGAEKWEFLQSCTWASLDQVIEGPAKKPKIVGEWIESYRAACHIWAAHAIWIEWWDIAAAFIAMKSDPISLQNFSNSWLGEVFENQIDVPKRSTLTSKINRSTHPADKVPAWAGVLVATADTQKDHFWYVIRAWGHGKRSMLVKYGRVQSLAMLEELCLRVKYEVVGGDSSVIDSIYPSVLLIDSGGHRTSEIYRFAEIDPDRIYPTKGASHQQRAPVIARRVTYKPVNGQSSINVMLQMFDVDYFKDLLARMQKTTADNSDNWELHRKTDDDYIAQLTAQHKVLIRTRSGERMTWEPIGSGVQDHYFDCEVLQLVGAEIVHANLIPDEDELTSQRKIWRDEQANIARSIATDTGSEWLLSHKGRW